MCINLVRVYAYPMSAVRADGSEGELTESRGAEVPCSGLRKELLECLRGSDCVKVVSVFTRPREPGCRCRCGIRAFAVALNRN